MRSAAAALLFVAALASTSAQDAYNQELRGDRERVLSVATAKASKASGSKSSKT